MDFRQSVNVEVGAAKRIGFKQFAIARKGRRGHLIYGPYAELRPGRHAVTFGFADIAYSEDVHASGYIGRVEVVRAPGDEIFAVANILGDRLRSLRSLTLPFELTEATTVEFRLLSDGLVPIAVATKTVCVEDPDREAQYCPVFEKGFRPQSALLRAHFSDFRELHEAGAGIAESGPHVTVRFGAALHEARSADDVRGLRERFLKFPPGFSPPGEAGKSYQQRRISGFFDRYCSGRTVLDVGFAGYDNPGKHACLPEAIGIDLDYPGYDGTRLPFEDGSVDTVFSSHCIEHIPHDQMTIRDWHRVVKVGGFIVCIAPSQALYEKRRFTPSRFNQDHKRFYTPSSLLRSFEEALEVNSYRVRHLRENDSGYNYDLGPEHHAEGCFEIELVLEKIRKPAWTLAA